MSNPNQPVPGWYPDPHGPSQLRYWNGEAWTESVTPSQPQSHSALPDPWAGQPPFAQGTPVPPPPNSALSGGPSGLGDVGGLISATFSSLVRCGANLAILLFVVPLVGWLALMALVYSLLGGMSLNAATGELEGFDTANLILGAVVMVALMVVGGAGWMAAVHQLYQVHVDQPRTVGQSLGVALRRVPRALGWGLVLGLLLSIVLGILIGLGVGAVLIDPVLGVVTILALMPITVVVVTWLWVKLAFFTTAVVLAPPGASPLTTSMGLSAGRFWAVLGRVALLYIVVGVIAMVFSLINQVLFIIVSTTLGWGVDGVTGKLLIDGRPAEGMVDFDLFLPSPMVTAIVLIVVVGGQAVTQAVSISGYAGLYQRAAGPVDPSL